MILTGYINAVGRESRQLTGPNGKFTEIITPGAFAASLANYGCNEIRLNHSVILNCSELDLIEDPIGLKVKANVNDDQIRSLVGDQPFTGWSFGFSCLKDRWETREDGSQLRHVDALRLQEVSVLTITPAYIATTVENRDGTQLETRCSDTIDVDNTQKVLEQLHLRKQAFNFNFNRK